MNYSQLSGLLFAFAIGPITGISQNTLSGKVTDEKTGEPIPSASVFFTNTTIGNSTLTDGTFQIKNIPNGKYDLTVSYIGYKRFQKSFEFPGPVNEIKIVLKQDPVSLAEITVVADQSDYKKYFPTFKKLFLGESRNALKCEIVNPEVIHLYYDEEGKLLTGHASKPIEVENKPLGYRVFYTLDLFELSYKSSTQKLAGIARFEELPVTDRKDSIKRSNSRLLAYKGSLNHFMRSLYNKSAREEGFIVSNSPQPTMAYISNSQIPVKPVDIGPHISGEASRAFWFTGTMRVEYEGEFEAWEYRNTRNKNPGNQISLIKLNKGSITIFENGYYVDQFSVYLDGYLAWSETIGEKLPLSYYPPPVVSYK